MRDPDDDAEGVFEQLVADAAKKDTDKKDKKHRKRPGSTKSKASKVEDWEEVKMPSKA